MQTRTILGTVAAIAVTAALAVGALAQSGGHGGHSGHAPAAGNTDNAAVRAYREANDRMHQGMAIAFTGDADVDFAMGMIPHHEGAIDMARIVLKYGSDPDIRQLAEEVVATQEAEIQILRDWLRQRGH